MTDSKKFSATQSKMLAAVRSGHHATVYEVRRDPDLENKDIIRDRNEPVFPFVGGAQYKGQWNNDMKDGFGIQINPDNTKYEGEWMNNKYHGRGTLWMKKKKNYQRQYVGDWVNGKMEGQGIYYYENGEIYRGGWLNGQKSGNGRQEFSTGDVYVGDWANDSQQGFGTMNYANGNIFEGLWANGKKEGPGLFFYASTKKIYQGEWTKDQPKCGEYRSPTNAEELRFVHPLPKGIHLNNFKLPELGLANPQGILDFAISSTRLGNVQRSLSKPDLTIPEIPMSLLEIAKSKFNEILRASNKGQQNEHGSDTIAISSLGDILRYIGIQISELELDGIKTQLMEREIQSLSFADVAEIIAFIQSEEHVYENFSPEEKYYK